MRPRFFIAYGRFGSPTIAQHRFEHKKQAMRWYQRMKERGFVVVTNAHNDPSKNVVQRGNRYIKRPGERIYSTYKYW